MKAAKKIARKHRRIKEYERSLASLRMRGLPTAGYRCPGSNKR